LLGNVGQDGEVIVADMEAGIGTLTRIAEKDVDAVLVVVEATPKSLEVGSRAAALVTEKSLGRLIVVGNRVRGDADLAAIQASFPGAEVVAVPDDPEIVKADRVGPLSTLPPTPPPCEAWWNWGSSSSLRWPDRLGGPSAMAGYSGWQRLGVAGAAGPLGDARAA